MRIVLVSPYDLGRQPFALAHPAALLRAAGHSVEAVDLSLQKLSAARLEGAGLVAVHLGMHTATRIALEIVDKARALVPEAVLCAYGLYAPMNEAMLRERGFATILGGEYEPGLLALAERISGGGLFEQSAPVISLERFDYVTPDRAGLLPLSRYASLQMPDGSERVTGFVQASRGCKHLCRHCPVVPVYQGKFRVAAVDVVLEDIKAQVEAGAEHISFGDPDFLNGPRHALRILRAMREVFPDLTFDAVIKIEHLLKHADLLPELRDSGCLFVLSAVESVDETILAAFDKGHTAQDFRRAAGLMREAGIALAPTFVPFTPWTSAQVYLDLLGALVDLKLVEAVSPVQLAIRLLVPAGSYLLKLEGFEELIGDFDPVLLGYPWKNPDPRVDDLQKAIQSWVAKSADAPRREVFEGIWRMAHEAAGLETPTLPDDLGCAIPQMSEPWYCCAEPTEQQLTGL